MGLQKFTVKDPDEILQYSFDFSLVMPDVTETIVSTSWFVYAQADATNTHITSMIVPASSSNGARICSQYVKYGVSNTTYVLSCEVTTNKNEVIKLSGVLPVRTFR